MRPPTAGLEDYMKTLMAGRGAAPPTPQGQSLGAQTIAELNKAMSVRAQLQAQLQSTDAQILKLQGALDVLRRLGQAPP